MLLEAMFRGEFYPSETVVPRDPAYRTLQKASNDLLETLKARLKGEDFQLVEQLLEQDLNVRCMECEWPLPLRLLGRAAARAGSPTGTTVQEAAMRVIRFFLKLLAIPILLVLLAIQWGLTFVVSLSGWIFHLLSGIIFATAILSGLMELCPWQEAGSMLIVSFVLFLLPHLAATLVIHLVDVALALRGF